MFEHLNQFHAIVFFSIVIVLTICLLLRSATRRDRACLNVALLAAALDDLRSLAASPERENDRQLAALLSRVQDNLGWARLALIIGKYDWTGTIVAMTNAEIAKRSLSQAG